MVVDNNIDRQFDVEETKGQGSGPFGSRITGHKLGLGFVPKSSQSGALHEPAWKLSRSVVAESVFNLPKREKVRRRTYKTREGARRDVFDYIEMFYNPKRKHVRNGMLSPVEFQRQQKLQVEGV